jgi:hypothetical protein
MSYHNDILLGATPSVLDGVPYGKGWSLNIPTISITTSDYNSAISYNARCHQSPTDCPGEEEIIAPLIEGSLQYSDQ